MKKKHFFTLICDCISLLEPFSKFRSFESFVCPGGNYPGGKCLDGNRLGEIVRVGVFFGWEISRGELPGGTVLVGKLSGGTVREEFSGGK